VLLLSYSSNLKHWIWSKYDYFLLCIISNSLASLYSRKSYSLLFLRSSTMRVSPSLINFSYSLSTRSLIETTVSLTLLTGAWSVASLLNSVCYCPPSLFKWDWSIFDLFNSSTSLPCHDVCDYTFWLDELDSVYSKWPETTPRRSTRPSSFSIFTSSVYYLDEASTFNIEFYC